jgi:hypothetical protein
MQILSHEDTKAQRSTKKYNMVRDKVKNGCLTTGRCEMKSEKILVSSCLSGKKCIYTWWPFVP